MTIRPFRFGFPCPSLTGRELTEFARRAEAAGHSTLLMSDHLDLSGDHICRLSPLEACAAAAAVTTELWIGTQMLNQDLRHPAVLAREVASLQLLSDGRFEVGIGAGWNELEYDWAGLTYDPIGQRIERLGEYVELVRRLQLDDRVTFEGRHFHVRDMPSHARGVAEPARLGMGGGQKRILSLAARAADVVSIILFQSPGMSAAGLDQRVGWVRDAAPERADELELSLPIIAVLPGDEAPLDIIERAVAERSVWGLALAEGMSPEQILASPCFLVGTPAAMVERLLELRERWNITFPTFGPEALEHVEPVMAELGGR